MVDENVDVILRCKIECDKTTEGLRQLNKGVEEVQEQAMKPIEMAVKPIKAPKLPKLEEPEWKPTLLAPKDTHKTVEKTLETMKELMDVHLSLDSNIQKGGATWEDLRGKAESGLSRVIELLSKTEKSQDEVKEKNDELRKLLGAFGETYVSPPALGETIKKLEEIETLTRKGIIPQEVKEDKVPIKPEIEAPEMKVPEVPIKPIIEEIKEMPKAPETVTKCTIECTEATEQLKKLAEIAPKENLMKCRVECEEATRDLEKLKVRAEGATTGVEMKLGVDELRKVLDLMKAGERRAERLPRIKPPTAEAESLEKLGKLREKIERAKVAPEIKPIAPKEALTSLGELEGKLKEGGITTTEANQRIRELTEGFKKAKKPGEELALTEEGVKTALAKLPRVVGANLKVFEKFGKMVGVKVPKITEEGGMRQVRMFRWIGRDMIRLGRMTKDFGKVATKVWAAMVQNSVALESIFYDIRLSFEDVTAELGEALAPHLEWVSDLVRRLANVLMGLPTSAKAVIGGFIMMADVMMKLIPIWMMLYGYIMLGRFSLLQATVAAGLNAEQQKTLEAQTMKTGRAFGFLSRNVGKFAILAIGLAGTVSIATAKIGMWEKVIGMATMGAIIGGAAFGGLGAVIGGVAGAIGGLITSLLWGKEEGDEITESTLRYLRALGYTEDTTFEMAKGVRASFLSVKNQYADTADQQDAFRWEMEALGFTMDESARLFELMGGEISETSDYFKAMEDRVETLAIVMGVTEEEITSALHKWGIETPGEILNVFAKMEGNIPANITSLEDAIVLAGFSIGRALSLTSEECTNFMTRIRELSSKGIIEIKTLLEGAEKIVVPWETAMTTLESDMSPLEKALKLTTGYDFQSLVDAAVEIEPSFLTTMETLESDVDIVNAALKIVMGTSFNPLITAAENAESPFSTAMNRLGEPILTIQEQIDGIKTRLETLPTDVVSDISLNITPVFGEVKPPEWYWETPGWLTDFLDFFKPVTKPLGDLIGAGADLVGDIASGIHGVLEDVGEFFGIKGKVLPWFQRGGPVTTTGPYILHAGEFVLPRGAPVNVSNVFNLSASVRSETDISELAEEISRKISESYRRG